MMHFTHLIIGDHSFSQGDISLKKNSKLISFSQTHNILKQIDAFHSIRLINKMPFFELAIVPKIVILEKNDFKP